MIALAFLASAAATAAADDNPLKTFKDWVVGCDNGRACMAVGQFAEGNSDTLTLAIDRGAGAGDRPVIWFRDDGDSNPTDWSVDGKPLGLKFVSYKQFNVAVSPETTDRALAALIGSAPVMTVQKIGQDRYTVSANGASAALRWMDVAQHRDGTVTALVAKGSKPAATVPPPPALPSVIRRMPAKLPPPDTFSAKAADQWREKIFECTDEKPDSQMVESKRLDARTTLVMITASCASGAYNYLYIPLLLRKGQKPLLAKFQGRSATDDEGDGLYNLYWHEDDPRVLGSYFKGRGLGDCGGGTDWVWDGTMFRVVGESSMGDCQGAPGWITTFRARIVDK
jgi:hypothetical protein